MVTSQRIDLKLLNGQAPIRAPSMCIREWVGPGNFLNYILNTSGQVRMNAHALLFSVGPTHNSNSTGAAAGTPWLHIGVREDIQGKGG